jgi:hypothetical protein
VLYTNEEFNNEKHNTTFLLFIRDNDCTLLDLNINTMKVNEIPSAADKIVVEKTVITDATTLIIAGFIYKIEGVGEL